MKGLPRELNYNQFDDLINNVSLLISMAFNSMTIWQALSCNIPAIACNDIHPNSFFR